MGNSKRETLELRLQERAIAAGTLDDLSVAVARGVSGDAYVSARDRDSVRWRVDSTRRALVYVPKKGG